MQYKTNTISISYELKYQLKQCNYIQFTEDFKMAYNFRISKNITTSNNSKWGFWHNRKFYQLSKIKDQVDLIPKYEKLKNNWLCEI